MRSIPIGAGLLSPVKLLFEEPIWALLPQINREPINTNLDDEHYEALRTCWDKYTKGKNTCEDSFSFPIGYTVAATVKMVDHGHMV